MAVEKCLIIFSLLFSVSVVVVLSKGKDKIDADYYFGRSALRTKEELRWKKTTELLPDMAARNGQDKVSNQNNKDEAENSPENDRPALRHHIAHFCPNLDDARVCIRKCSKEGKPAFCGKDHRCYCGHKYNAHDQKGAMDTEGLYAQFRDLYEKYFGPNTNDDSVDDDDDDKDHEIKTLERM